MGNPVTPNVSYFLAVFQAANGNTYLGHDRFL